MLQTHVPTLFAANIRGNTTTAVLGGNNVCYGNQKAIKISIFDCFTPIPSKFGLAALFNVVSCIEIA